MQDARFRAAPKPDGEVVALLERTLAAAREGHVRTIAIIVVNPVNQVEPLLSGDLTSLRSNVLLGGLIKTIYELLTR